MDQVGLPARVVLDTDVLVDLLRGRREAIERVRELMESGASLATTAVNVFEVAWGAYRLGRPRDAEDLAEALPVLNLTAREALKAGEEIAHLSSLGATLDLRDVLVGVIARENGYAVLTGNVRHLSRVRSLKVLEYKR